MTGPTSPGIHRLRPNHREWTPPQVMFIDTETSAELTDAGEIHTLRCWAARLDVRRTRRGTGLGTSTGYGYDTAELADQVEIFAEGQKTLWVYAHNLGFDLSVTRLPAELHSRGWAVTSHALTSDSPWLRMKRGNCVLTFADSWGWLRAELSAVAADLGMTKLDLPAESGAADSWLARCETDVTILATAMLTLMDWWDEQQLGSWTLTGSAGGWNCWRHKTTMALPLIVPGAEQLDADRAAIYGGRREAFTHGEQPAGSYLLLDFKSAYPSIAAALDLPAARQGDFQSMPVDSPVVCGNGYGIIARVRVRTDQPRYPVRVAGRVAYPAGEFETTLAGPEIAEARRLGHLVSIGPGYLHKLSPHMTEWAGWVLRVTDSADTSIPAVAKRTVKHWGRAVIGKTAAKGWRIIPVQSLGGTGWDYRPAYNVAEQANSHLIDVCGQAAEVIACGDGDNAYPAILAWVESWVRVYLSRAIDALGADSVLTCDTDGLITSRRRDWRQRLAQVDLGPLTMRCKAVYTRVRVIGPQHVITPEDSKLSGIPKSAEPGDDGKLHALLWPGLTTQMNLRPGTSSAAYVRPRQSYTVPNSAITGHVRHDGVVKPLTAEICVSGNTHLLPLPEQWAPWYPPEKQAKHVSQLINPITVKGSECTCRTSRSHGNHGESNRSAQIMSSTSRQPKISQGVAKLLSWLITGGWRMRPVPPGSSGRTRT